tara:strand:+ start:6378 stop:7049 length:672 start_codon:yes stop_codon:yes gene_type:complete
MGLAMQQRRISRVRACKGAARSIEPWPEGIGIIAIWARHKGIAIAVWARRGIAIAIWARHRGIAMAGERARRERGRWHLPRHAWESIGGSNCVRVGVGVGVGELRWRRGVSSAFCALCLLRTAAAALPGPDGAGFGVSVVLRSRPTGVLYPPGVVHAGQLRAWISSMLGVMDMAPFCAPEEVLAVLSASDLQTGQATGKPVADPSQLHCLHEARHWSLDVVAI